MKSLVSFLLEPWVLIFKNINNINALYYDDLRMKFAAGNVLGWAWIVLYPLLFLGAYSLLFIGLMSIRLPDMSPEVYILVIFVGLIAWFAIAEALAGGAGLVHNNVNILKNTFYPMELIGVRMALVHLTQFLISLILLLSALLIFKQPFWTWLQIPVLMFSLFIAIVGLYWLLGTIGAFFKDLVNTVNVLIMLMFLISPIGYTEDMVGDRMQAVLAYNPVTYVIRGFRLSITEGLWLNWQLIAGLLLIPLTLFYLGYFLFSRLKNLFAELV